MKAPAIWRPLLGLALIAKTVNAEPVEPILDSPAPLESTGDGKTEKETDSAAPQPTHLPGGLDLNYYYDTREFTTLTVNTFLVLPLGFSYFGFVDFDNKPDHSETVDTNQAYSELNLQWGDYGSFPIELHTQWALGTSPFVTDRFRAGLRFHAPPATFGKALADFGLMLHLTYFPFVQRLNFEGQEAGWESQIAVAYKWTPFAEALDRRIYVSGWTDFDLFLDKKHEILSEHQIGLRLFGGLHAVAELRHFSFEEPPTGVGFGAQYQLDLGVPLSAP